MSASSRKVKWEITRDFLTERHGNGKSAVGVKGPRDCPGDDQDGDFTWTRFRLYDDDGELYYEGRMNEHCNGLEPLDHFGLPNAGCTELREWVPGKGGGWKTV